MVSANIAMVAVEPATAQSSKTPGTENIVARSISVSLIENKATKEVRAGFDRFAACSLTVNGIVPKPVFFQ